jgi:L-fucose isomerase-like protein
MLKLETLNATAPERIALKPVTLGVIVGNRGFFPNHLCEEGRKDVLAVLAKEGFETVALTPDDTPFGSVETRAQAKQCADLFQRHAGEIDGILVTLPNFGDERGIAETLRLAGLNVPVLIHAFPDDARRMSIQDRRDSFCGKLSVCNNLGQYGIPFSLTARHTVAPNSPAFRDDLKRFAAVCRVTKGLRRARIGAIGARPAAFKTVRYSEKILETSGIAVETIDLSEVLGRVGKLDDAAEAVQAKLKEIDAYVDTRGVPHSSLMKMAKLAAVVEDWIVENELDSTAMQCWTAIEEFFGVVPCTVMSMLSNRLMPSACEVDITGAIGMYSLTLASGVPAALLDWNNNYGDDPDRCILFHCSNLPTGCLSCAKMSQQDIIGGTVGIENTYGTVVGTIKTGPFTYARVATDDRRGVVRAYVGEGEFVDDPLDTFGGVGVAHIPNLQGLMRYLCEQGFEHHVAATHDAVAGALHEAMGKYLGWDVYHHAA